MKNLNIKTNSKEVNKEDDFICITNELHDRHYFISEVYKNCNKIIVNKKYFQTVKDTNYYLYKKLSKYYHHPERSINLIGITGTDGKTTCACLINDLLNNFYKSAYLGTNGFIIDDDKIETKNTTPNTDIILKCLHKAKTKKAKFLVMEASSEGLHYNRLSKLKLDIGILTNITEDHLNTHKTIENYVNTKLKLFKNLKKNGIAILNKDDDYFSYFKENINKKIITYGKDDADYSIKNITQDDNLVTFNLHHKHKIYEIKSPLLGEFNVYNLTCAIIVLEHFGINIEKIIPFIKKLKQAEGRMEFLDFKQSYKLIIDYAHTKNSTYQILTEINKIKHNKIITVVGCAGGREKEKRPDIGHITSSLSDIVIFTMDDPRYELVDDIIHDMLQGVNKKNYLIIKDRKKAIKKAMRIAKDDDIVVILGKGRDNYMAIGNEYVKYSDIDVIKQHLKK